MVAVQGRGNGRSPHSRERETSHHSPVHLPTGIGRHVRQVRSPRNSRNPPPEHHPFLERDDYLGPQQTHGVGDMAIRPLAMSSMYPSGGADPLIKAPARTSNDGLPPSTPYQGARPDWRWWREWPVPQEVNREIASLWSPEKPLSDQVIASTQTFLRWRSDTITDHNARIDGFHLTNIQPFFSIFCGIHVRGSTDLMLAVNRTLSIIPREIIPPSRPSQDVTLGEFVRAARVARRDYGVSRKDLRDSFYHLQALRRLSLGTLGAYSGHSGEIWINPPIRNVPHEIGTASVLAHELGGHLAVNGGASGPVARFFHWASMNPVVHIVDPFEPITQRVLTVMTESAAIGANWEYVSRIPRGERGQPNVRQELMTSIREAMREHADLLDLPSQKANPEIKRRFEDIEDRKYYGSHHSIYESLAMAHLPKRDFIRQERLNIGYAPLQQILKPTISAWRWARHEGYYRDFVGARAFYAAKLGVYGTLAYLGYQALDSDD